MVPILRRVGFEEHGARQGSIYSSSQLLRRSEDDLGWRSNGHGRAGPDIPCGRPACLLYIKNAEVHESDFFAREEGTLHFGKHLIDEIGSLTLCQRRRLGNLARNIESSAFQCSLPSKLRT